MEDDPFVAPSFGDDISLNYSNPNDGKATHLLDLDPSYSPNHRNDALIDPSNAISAFPLDEGSGSSLAYHHDEPAASLSDMIDSLPPPDSSAYQDSSSGNPMPHEATPDSVGGMTTRVVVPQILKGDPSAESAVTNVPESPKGKAKGPVTRRGRKKKDPNAPASVSSAYAFFFKEIQGSVKAKNPNIKFGEVSKIVAHMWENLGEEEKSVYRKKNEQDKERFESEMSEYKARQALMSPGDESQDPSPPNSATPPKRESLKRGAAARSQVKLVTRNHGQISAQLQSRLQPPESDDEDEEEDSNEPTSAAPAQSVVAPVGGHANGTEYPVMEHPCIRVSCDNFAIKNEEWEDEYCSNECAVQHCKSVFKDWITAQNAGAIED